MRKQGAELVITWSDGSTSVIEWNRIQQAAGIGHLPAPSCAFCTEPDGSAAGLVFESNSPAPGLRYQEPHSLIPTLGWLTQDGIRDRR